MPAGTFEAIKTSDLSSTKVWLVEGSEPTLLEDAVKNRFFEGACYLVLQAKSSAASIPERLDIHVWAGSRASKDTADASVALAFELDDAVAGKGLLHRQVQGQESNAFLQAFNGRLHYSTLPQTANGAGRQRPVLHEVQAKNQRAVRVLEAPAEARVLHSNACFILEDSSCIYTWAGSSTSRAARAAAIHVAMELGGNAMQVVTLEEEESSSQGAQAFYRALGCTDIGGLELKRSSRSAPGPGLADMADPQLFKVTDGPAGPLVGGRELGTPTASKLEGETAALLVAGGVAYLWLSAAVPRQDQQAGFSIAEQALSQLSLPSTAPVQLVIQGHESQDFLRHLGQGQPARANGVAPAAGEPQALSPAEEAMFADPKSSTSMWRVKGSTSVEVTAKQAGQLYAGNVYVIHHGYKEAGVQKESLFIWQGKSASQIDIEASGIVANTLNKRRCNGSASQVRIPQGREPAFFPMLFKGKAIFHEGNADELQKNPMRPALYKLFGSGQATQAQQVPVQAASLSSAGCYLLLTAASTVFQWQSRASSKDEHKAATGFANRLMPYAVRKVVAAEGQEPDAFWEALGGRGTYQSEGPAVPEPANHPAPPQLLLLSETAPGGLEDLPEYSQDDLDDQDIFLLDAFYSVFVWVGRASDAAGQKAAAKKAQQLGQRDGRAANTPVSLVQPGQEPSLFTAAFPSWDPRKASQAADPYQQALRRLRAQQPGLGSAGPQPSPTTVPNGMHPAPAAAQPPATPHPSPAPQTTPSKNAQSAPRPSEPGSAGIKPPQAPPPPPTSAEVGKDTNAGLPGAQALQQAASMPRGVDGPQAASSAASARAETPQAASVGQPSVQEHASGPVAGASGARAESRPGGGPEQAPKPQSPVKFGRPLPGMAAGGADAAPGTASAARSPSLTSRQLPSVLAAQARQRALDTKPPQEDGPSHAMAPPPGSSRSSQAQPSQPSPAEPSGSSTTDSAASSHASPGSQLPKEASPRKSQERGPGLSQPTTSSSRLQDRAGNVNASLNNSIMADKQQMLHVPGDQAGGLPSKDAPGGDLSQETAVARARPASDTAAGPSEASDVSKAGSLPPAAQAEPAARSGVASPQPDAAALSSQEGGAGKAPAASPGGEGSVLSKAKGIDQGSIQQQQPPQQPPPQSGQDKTDGSTAASRPASAQWPPHSPPGARSEEQAAGVPVASTPAPGQVSQAQRSLRAGSADGSAGQDRVAPARNLILAKAASIDSGALAPETAGAAQASRRQISRINIAAIFNRPPEAPLDQASAPLPRPKSPPRSAPTPPPMDLKLIPLQDFVEYEQLKGMRVEDGLDMTRKEDYLSPESFAQVFGQERDAFQKLPKWRQVMAKKQHGLF